jgi:hypothetical protein
MQSCLNGIDLVRSNLALHRLHTQHVLHSQRVAQFPKQILIEDMSKAVKICT